MWHVWLCMGRACGTYVGEYRTLVLGNPKERTTWNTWT
jgi:hypothetical protein